jgi:hypothetical protein
MALAAIALVANCFQQWPAIIAEPAFAEHQSPQYS